MASRVLVVDDDQLVRRMFTDVFAECGWEAVAVPDGEVALEALEQHHFDAILVDKNMPGMSGLELVRRVRRTDERVVCAIITGYPSAESAMSALQLDIDAYLEKPAPDPFGVVDRIETLVRKRAQRIALLEVSRSPSRNRGQPALRALVATESAVDSGAIESWLRGAGVVVETVMGLAPAAVARALDEHPRLLFLDSSLARASIASYMAELRSAGFAAACVILAEEALALPAVIEFIELEVAAIIEKPIEIAELERRLRPVLASLSS